MSERRPPIRTRAVEDESDNAVESGPALHQLSASAAASALSGLQRDIGKLAGRVESLPRRFAAAQHLMIGTSLELVDKVAAAGREAAFDFGVLASNAAKALESGAEEARVRAAQLEACAVLLESEAEDGEEKSVAATACALVSHSAAATPAFVGVYWASAPLLLAVQSLVHVRDGIDPRRCTVCGKGLITYQAGDWGNHLSVVAIDGEGDVVESIEAEDVSVTVQGRMVTGTVGEAGVDVEYRMPAGCVEPVTISVSVCGAALRGSPWIATCPLGDSAILATVAPERVAAFLRELTTQWLPGREYTLLYRGSRDGMTAAAFHSLCDGKGPTLVLVRCDQGWVFGGYAGASWASPAAEECAEDWGGASVASSNAFVLSVVGPHSPGPVQFPVLKADIALDCCADLGPSFCGGLSLCGSWVATDVFNRESFCGIGDGSVVEDVLGKGDKSLTGTRNFTPAEVEVFAVMTTGS